MILWENALHLPDELVGKRVRFKMELMDEDKTLPILVSKPQEKCKPKKQPGMVEINCAVCGRKIEIKSKEDNVFGVICSQACKDIIELI